MNRTLIEKFFDSIISTAYAPGLSYVKVVADEAFYPIEIKNALDWTKYNVVLPIEQMTEEDWSNLWSATAERYDKYVNQGGVYNTINFWGSGIPEAVVTLLKINGHNGQIAWNDPRLYNYANYLTMGLVDQFNKAANTPMSDPEYWRAMRTLLTTEATAIGIYNAIASGTALPTTTEELIKWGDKYSKTPSGTVSSGTFDSAFEISATDKAKLDGWKFRPDDQTYAKYKSIYDNPKYFDQNTGSIQWPSNDGFDGSSKQITLEPGMRIDRYGEGTGYYTSPFGTPYSERSLAPNTDKRPYTVYEVVKPIQVEGGKIAPWFDEPGGGIQYIMPESLDQLVKESILKEVK
ncbi:MAG: TNT domain-containing protein [Christensenellales bacterium]